MERLPVEPARRQTRHREMKKRHEIILTAMASGGSGASFDPLRIQKLLFLIDAEIPDLTGGPHFRFEPYDYGPFDRTIFETLRELARRSLVVIGPSKGRNDYSLTPAGLSAGSGLLAALPEGAREFMTSAANWVRLSTFRRILTVIYRQYPEMAKNAVIPELTASPSDPARARGIPSFLSGAARLLDFTGSFDPPLYPKGPEEDATAIRRDWEAVGDDLEYALAQLGPPIPVR